MIKLQKQFVQEEKADFSSTYTRPSKQKMVFYVVGIVPEAGGKYLASDFEFRICYVFMDHNPTYVSSPYAAPVSKKSFEGASPWAVSDIGKAAEFGFISDKIKGKMDAPITREEFAEIAVIFYEKITGSKAIAAPTSTFADTLNPEILKAFELKITYGAGKDTTGKHLFKPNNLLDREQMAAMITNSLKAVYPNINLSSSNVPGFADEKEISSWALESAKFMKKYKITEGIGNNNYGPKQNCTREQAVIFLTKAYEKKSEYSLD